MPWTHWTASPHDDEHPGHPDVSDDRIRDLVPGHLRVDGYAGGMLPPRLPVNIGHYEDTFSKPDGTWLLARRVTVLPFGSQTQRLLPARSRGHSTLCSQEKTQAIYELPGKRIAGYESKIEKIRDVSGALILARASRN